MDVAVRAVSAGLMLLLPLGLWLALMRRFRLGLNLVAAGAVMFIVSQVFHLPFNAWALPWVFQWLGLQEASGGLTAVLTAVLLGLSAGVFEETARYLAYCFWLRDVRDWRQAVLFGAGHGGIEAILLGALALLTLFQLSSMRNVDLATVVPPEQVEVARQQVQAYWSASWAEALLPALERVLAMALHISLALMVLRARLRSNAGWLALAIAWHAGTNAMGLLVLERWGPYAAEGAIALLTMGALAIAWNLRPRPAEPTEEHPAPDHTSPRRPEATRPRENLDETRYLE